MWVSKKITNHCPCPLRAEYELLDSPLFQYQAKQKPVTKVTVTRVMVTEVMVTKVMVTKVMVAKMMATKGE